MIRLSLEQAAAASSSCHRPSSSNCKMLASCQTLVSLPPSTKIRSSSFSSSSSSSSHDAVCSSKRKQMMNSRKKGWQWNFTGNCSSFACKASEDTSSSSPASSSSSSELVEIPLFPLPLVLFPGAILPLQIFEFRYRIMMHTLLQTDLRFGVIFTDRSTGLAEVGCVGEVIKYERLVDDRFFLICKGQERFKVMNVVRTTPYMVAEVEWIEDKPSPSPSPSPSSEDKENESEDVEALANEVEKYMKDVIRLSNRMNKKKSSGSTESTESTTEDSNLRKNLFPTPFSFWVGSTFEGAPLEQQALLELKDTALRLKREKETLRNTLNYLTAASAVKDAFASSD